MRSEWIALVTAYQAAEQFLLLLEEAKNSGFELLVVDDGSGENFRKVFRAAARYGTVLCHAGNKGKGQAIKTGLSYIREHCPRDCTVVTMDANGQHRVVDAKRSCKIAQDNPDTLVLGSRKLLAFSAKLIPQLLAVPGERYEYEMNALLACSRTGIPILDEESDIPYIDGNAVSHFDTVKDSWRVYKEILKFSAASLISFLVDYGLYSMLTVRTAGWGSTRSILISNVGARIVSACVNYIINRSLVFQSKGGVVRSAVQYAVLAGGILAGNTIVLSFLADDLGINRYAAKLITELIFFLMSWLLQRKIIFRER